MALEDSQEREELLQVVQVFIAFFAAEFGVRFAPHSSRSALLFAFVKADVQLFTWGPDRLSEIVDFAHGLDSVEGRL